MNRQDFLREQTRILKAKEDITFKEIAEDLLEINVNSFYNWLNGAYNLGTDKETKLYDYIVCLMD